MQISSNKMAQNTRRNFLYSLGASLGSVAFSDLLAKETTGPLAEKEPHLPPKAKACIFLVMEGGPSHIDTFDPKPKLEQLHLQPLPERRRALLPHVLGRALLRSEPLQVPQSRPSRYRHVRALPPSTRGGGRAVRLQGRPRGVGGPPHGALPYQHRQQVRRRPGDGVLGDLRAGQRESESSRIHRLVRGGISAGRIRQLDERLPSRLFPRHAVARRGIADPRHSGARLEDPPAPARQSRYSRGSQPFSPGSAPRPRRTGGAHGQLRTRLPPCRRKSRGSSTSAASRNQSGKCTAWTTR